MPDLTLARATLEAAFDAECVIVRDRQGHTDDLRDPSTLELIRPSDDSGTIYAGACLCRPVQGFGRTQRDEAGTVQYVDTWRLRLPVTADNVTVGDVVRFSVSPNDSQLLDREFTVSKIAGGSLSVSRILFINERQRGPRI